MARPKHEATNKRSGIWRKSTRGVVRTEGTYTPRFIHTWGQYTRVVALHKERNTHKATSREATTHRRHTHEGTCGHTQEGIGARNRRTHPRRGETIEATYTWNTYTCGDIRMERHTYREIYLHAK